MKNIIASIAFACYLTTTSGVIINFHYCMDRLASLEFFAAESKTCGKCGMKIKDSNGCCKDEVKIIKMNADQKAATSIVFELPALDAVPSTPSAFISASFFNIDQTRHHRNHSPPLLTKQDTYLDNCVFRI
jgi:hypothetical protein